MPFATVNGFRILEATVSMPRGGRWVADLVVDAIDTGGLTGAVTIQLGPSLELKGTAKRVGAFVEHVSMRVVGGAGGLMREIAPKAYQQVPLRIPLVDALAAVGETLSPLSDVAVLNTQLPHWSRMRGPASEEVRSLLARAPAGVASRVLPDGTVWVGAETWPEASFEFDLLDDQPWSGEATLGVDAPSLLPGTTFMGRRVEQVTHQVTPSRVRTHVQFTAQTAGGEPLSTGTSQDLDGIIQRAMKPARYLRLFPARVVQQNGDLTLELVLDDPIAPGLSNVPLRTFVPGVTVKVAAGARVGVMFEGGDPQRPVAVLFEQDHGSLLELHITATTAVKVDAPQVVLNGGLLPVARMTDTAGPYPIVGGNPSVKA